MEKGSQVSGENGKEEMFKPLLCKTMNSKKILITGTSGFVGGFLVEEALSRGLTVHSAVRRSSKTDILDTLDTTLVYFDFEDIDGMAQILRKGSYDYIIHNAGLTKAKAKEAYFKVNEQYLRNLIEAIRNADLQLDKFLFVSSLAAYGPADYQSDGIVKETSTPHPVTNYGRSKLAAEQYLKKQQDIPYNIIRPTAVYGPREYDLLTVYQTLAKHIEAYVGLTKQRLTFVYVRDLVRAMLDIVMSDHEDAGYFITDGNSYTAQQMNAIVKRELGITWTLPIKLPILLVKIIAFCSEKIAGLSGNYPPLNIEKVNELRARDWSCDVSPLENDIGFKPKYDLECGLKETITWCKENKLV